MHYRAFKYNFTSNPIDAPALYTYAVNTSAPTTYWMSWNGATRVASWRLFSSANRDGPWTAVGTVKKNGFETTFTAQAFHPWSIVESLDVDGKPLRNSTRAIRTFVPSAELAVMCNGQGCPSASNVPAPSATSNTTASGNSSAPTTTSAGVGVKKRGSTGGGMDGKLGFAAMFGLGAFIV